MKKELKNECMEELKKVLKDFTKEEDKTNSYLVRFHRLYLDGSYGDFADTREGGQKIYNLHVSRLSKNLAEKTIKDMAISTFRIFVSIEFFKREYQVKTEEIINIINETLGDNAEEFLNLIAENVTSFKEQYAS